jgi:MtN3 and saliva related transmembrane protein
MIIWIGIIAGIFTSIAALPQVVKSIGTRSTRDLSLWQPALLTVGVTLWLVYGAMIGDIPLLVMNVVPLAANLTLAVMKLKERASATGKFESYSDNVEGTESA